MRNDHAHAVTRLPRPSSGGEPIDVEVRIGLMCDPIKAAICTSTLRRYDQLGVNPE